MKEKYDDIFMSWLNIFLLSYPFSFLFFSIFPFFHSRLFVRTTIFFSYLFFLKSAKAFFLILSLLSFNATFSVWKNICVSVCVCIVYIWSIHQQFHSIVNKSKRKKFCAMSLCHHTHSEKWNRIYSVRHK